MQYLTREEFLETETGVRAKAELQKIINNPEFSTHARYDAAVGHKATFMERHLAYLTRYPYTNIDSYISNLKIMIRTSR